MDDQLQITRAHASAFVSGGGIMGERLRAFDWAATSLGSIDSWPICLRVTIDNAFASAFPTCVFWGPELVGIYNDAFLPIAGNKPHAFGRPFREVWAQAIDVIGPIAERALAGETAYIEDTPLTLQRNGALELGYYTFCYSPIFGEGGRIEGFLDIAMETTAKVRSARRTRQERASLQRLLKQMPGFAAVLAGPDFVFEYVNDAFIALCGPRDYISRTLHQVFPGSEGSSLVDGVTGVLASGATVHRNAILGIFNPAMGVRQLDLVFEAVRDEDGNLGGVFIGGFDVTERMRAEAESARLGDENLALERRIAERALVRSKNWMMSPDLLVVINGNGYIELANPAWSSVLGWSENELFDRPFIDLVHPDDIDVTISAWSQVTQYGVPFLRMSNRYAKKDGGWNWLAWSAVVEDGKVYCSARDVQHDKEAEAELAARTAERDLLATIVEDTNISVQAIALDYIFLAINRANADEYEQVFGRRPAVGDNLLAIFEAIADPAERAAATALWQRALGGETFTERRVFGNSALERRTYDMRFQVLLDADGRQIGAFETSLDVSERERQQEALLATQEALRQAQKMESVGQLTGGIAHDFNNLLGAISSSLQIMSLKLQRADPAGLKRYVDMGEASVKRAAALTQRLLAFSRRQTLDPKPVDVNWLIAGMEDLIRRTVGPSVELVLDCAVDLWSSRLDAPQLENSLLNLCINARDAMLPDGGRLTIHTANVAVSTAMGAELGLPAGDYITLNVDDSGSGIAPDIMARIFDPFFTTKPLGQGTGLGLSMVYGFVRQSGGTVRVTSTVGNGTCVRTYYPRFIGESAAAAQPAPADLISHGQGELVLLVEDEVILRELIQEVLVEAGFRVHPAGDGPTALQWLEDDQHVDLIVTDVGLPGGLNGRQVADVARLRRPGVGVLFITGYADNAAVGNGLMGTGMQVMTKPFELAALANKVREMIDSANARA